MDSRGLSVVLSVGQSVCLYVTVVSRAKTTEPIEMPFGLWTQVGPRNHVLDRDSDPPYQGAILRSKGVARSKV